MEENGKRKAGLGGRQRKKMSRRREWIETEGKERLSGIIRKEREGAGREKNTTNVGKTEKKKSWRKNKRDEEEEREKREARKKRKGKASWGRKREEYEKREKREKK